ncbi:MAG TPA: cytochrome P450 [Solirubrobacteraceae bacterium]|nr:cytochrome P450 [Solirubrobacteraceae bacterium]
MSVLKEAPATSEQSNSLIGSAPHSEAGPVESLDGLQTPPAIRWPRPVQVYWFGSLQWNFMFHHRKKFGDVWLARGYVRGQTATTSHPDHIASVFKAPPDLVPTLAAESPLRPVLGAGSVLTSNGPRHLRQRKLLLPPFHGEAIARYQQMIADAAEREIDRWPENRPFALAPRMQAITLDVIMAGIFGIEGRPRAGTAERGLRDSIKSLLWGSTRPGAKLAEWMNIGHDEPFGLTWLGLLIPDRYMYAVIRKRRRAADLEQRTDIMSLIMRARTEDGETLTDEELRDELMTLVLAGHETTANQLAWAWERLVRTPAAHERLIESVRGDCTDADDVVEATINEAMRVRPVIPVTGRRVTVPWRLGDYGVPADSGIAVSILLLHHREDLYPDPFSFRPERWIGHKPGTYEWLPFGGGTRRCLGAALAMAEQRVVLRAMAARLDLEAADDRPERPKHRNVTMIPARGGRVVIRSKR